MKKVKIRGEPFVFFSKKFFVKIILLHALSLFVAVVRGGGWEL